MKKCQLLIAPLLSLVFLASCRGNPEPKPSDAEVTKEEFEKSFEFEGVTYLQTHTYQAKGDSNGLDSPYYRVYTPAAFREVKYGDIEFTSQVSDTRVFKNSETDWDIYKQEAGQEWSKTTATERPSEFKEISYFVKIIGQIKEIIDYDQLKYDAASEKYSGTFSVEEEGEFFVVVGFKNKKIISISGKAIPTNLYTSYECSYDQIEIDRPEIQKGE